MKLHKRHFEVICDESSGVHNRRGAFMVLALFCLTAGLGFVSLSIDQGMISLTKTKLQNAVDAAALAAAQEIIASVDEASSEAAGGGDVGGQVADANAIAVEAAKAMAENVAELNGVYVDPGSDVRFGKRVYDEASDSFHVLWDVGPFNVVGVTARRDNPEPGLPDSKLSLFFAGVFGEKTAAVTASAVAFVEARDLVVVMDYSASMNDDSEFRSIEKLGQGPIEENMQDIFDALGPPNMGSMTFAPQWLVQSKTQEGKTVTVTFKYKEADVECTQNVKKIKLVFSDGSKQTFNGLSGTSHTKKGTGGNSGKTIDRVYVKSPNNTSSWVKLYDNTENVKSYFGLNNVNWPYPSGSWDSFIDHCRTDSDIKNAGYRRKYGGSCLVDYLLNDKPSFAKCPDLWKTPQYPFHAAKQGMTLFTQFLDGLDFGDHVGLVTYASYSKVQTGLNEPNIEAIVDLGDDLITDDYEAIDTIQRHKQAGHFASLTGIGYGIEDANELIQEYGRYGARPTILLMTDGLANRSPDGWSLPGTWDWSELTDYNGDGVADYTTSNVHKQYAFWQMKQAVDLGYTFHTMSVGTGADRDLMKAIAFAGGGQWIDVPGGSMISEMEEQLLDAFSRIAANVPPPKLLSSSE